MTKIIEFDKEEVALFSVLLDKAGNHFGNAGCNDLILPDTPSYRKLIHDAEEWSEKGSSHDPSHGEGKLIANDGLIFGYMAHLLGLHLSYRAEKSVEIKTIEQLNSLHQ